MTYELIKTIKNQIQIDLKIFRCQKYTYGQIVFVIFRSELLRNNTLQETSNPTYAISFRSTSSEQSLNENFHFQCLKTNKHPIAPGPPFREKNLSRYISSEEKNNG
jgi:hypothetical protein